jgi:hypothetical protein
MGGLVRRRLANRLLELITDAYQVKESGRMGPDGVQWPDITEATKKRKKSDLIGVDTGELLASLMPGEGDEPSGAAKQVFESGPGWLMVGTEVAHAAGFHENRPLWPETLPAAWLAELQAEAMAAVGEELTNYVG